MKTLISSNEILQKYVPNTLKAVAGELSLFDKIAYHLQQSETWLTQTFLSSKVLEKIITEDDSSPLLTTACSIIAVWLPSRTQCSAPSLSSTSSSPQTGSASSATRT